MWKLAERLVLDLGVELVKDADTLEPAPDAAEWIANRMRHRRVVRDGGSESSPAVTVVSGILISTDGPHHNVLKMKPPFDVSTHCARLSEFGA